MKNFEALDIFLVQITLHETQRLL